MCLYWRQMGNLFSIAIDISGNRTWRKILQIRGVVARNECLKNRRFAGTMDCKFRWKWKFLDQLTFPCRSREGLWLILGLSSKNWQRIKFLGCCNHGHKPTVDHRVAKKRKDSDGCRKDLVINSQNSKSRILSLFFPFHLIPSNNLWPLTISYDGSARRQLEQPNQPNNTASKF